MPTVEQNQQTWDVDYEWSQRGNEWSAAWGCAAMQWHGTIRPRVQRFLPAECILEIACGHGRWTEYLRGSCGKLVAVDLSHKCVEACRERFAGDSGVEFHINDGKSLEMVPDNSIDFVFSCDSLVHADSTVLQAYLSQLPRILKNQGGAFLHHSNLGEYAAIYSGVRMMPELKAPLEQLGVLDAELHWRDFGVSAELVEHLAADHGLACISQEIVPWGTKRAQIDCFSTIVKQQSPLARENRIYRNAEFMGESAYLRHLSRLYCS